MSTKDESLYTIYWMNQHNQDWTDDVLYTKEQAKGVLEGQGYQLNAGMVYTRTSGLGRAYKSYDFQDENLQRLRRDCYGMVYR